LEREIMGLVRTEITLKNVEDEILVKNGLLKKEDIRQTTLTALVDTGAWTLVINETVREELGIPITGIEPGTLADGSEKLYNLAGPLEGMDLTINPRTEEVVGVHGDEVLHHVT